MLTTDKRRLIRRCVTGTSALALATALVAGPAAAQSLSYNAPDPTVTSGTVTFQRGQTPGVEIYNVQSPTAVLDFTPSDTTGTGVINFQNAGTSATYQGASNFTVLNRIVPTDPSRAIQFNGTVRSLVSSSPGGSVWFFSPGGILAGNGAVFDVGSLLLSTADPTGGSGTISSTTSFNLSSSNPNAAVTIQPGAQIMATPEGSYVALVAPIVNQNGAVRVNGSAAYVAAESASLTFNQGLFDISVAVGSDGGGTPLTHNGTTTGPASNGGGDNHGIFMVAVPKNTAITMMIAPTGQLGFDVASSASVENGAIYLQAGGDLSVNQFAAVENRIQDLPTSALDANIDMFAGTVSSPLVAQARSSMQLRTSGTTPLVLQGETYLYGGTEAQIGSLTGGSFTAQDRVIVNSFGTAPGQAIVFAQAGATMDFQGAFDIFAAPYPSRIFPSNFDVTKGGAARLDAIGGNITATQLRINADGVGSVSGGDTFGGNTQLIASQGGSISLTGTVNLRAAASAFASSTATAGQASLSVAGGAIALTGNLTIDATATGSDGAKSIGGAAQIFSGAQGGDIDISGNAVLLANADSDASSASAGKATGGTAALDLIATTGSATTTVDIGTLNMRADATASGSSSAGSFAGGAAAAGLARLSVNKGVTLATATPLTMTVRANGGFGGPGGAGGDATGGSIQIHADGGAINASTMTLLANVSAGGGGSGPDASTAGGAGGNALAGNGISIFANNGGSITGANVFADATASGGNGGTGFNSTGLAGSGGSATAPDIFVGTDTNGQIILQSLTLQTTAIAGSTGFGAAQAGGTGGDGTSGDASVSANAGLVQLSSLNIEANVFGGNGSALGANGGKAVAGTADANAMNNGTLKITGGTLSLSAEAFGGDASGVPGGALVQAGEGVGGTANIFAGSGGTIDSSATGVFLDASGDGGAEVGTGNVTGATGRGGQARINANGGTITLRSEVDVIADGEGGDGGGTGNGGMGIGGEARLGTFGAVSSSKVEVTGNLFLDASGRGGGAELGRGGDGLGGTPPDLDNGPFDKGAYIVGTGGAISVTGFVDMDASGDGGDGGAGGGAGTGGLTDVIVFNASFSAASGISLDSSGSGGNGLDGAAGGLGTGGTSFVTASSGGDSLGGGVVPTGTPGILKFTNFFQDVSGQGGSGGAGLAGNAGGAGGDGLGGRATLIAQAGSGTLETGSVFIFLQGEGGEGGTGGAAASTGGTGGAGGKGGTGTGGFTNFGTASGPATTNNDGSATFTDVSVFADGIGGTGGDGTDGGNGGDGGAAFGGDATLLSRGALVTAGSVSIDSSAFGGQGGAGAVLGAGGTAEGGTATMLITNRFNRTERGALIAASFSGSGGALGGFGSSTGVTKAGQAFAQVTNSDATVGTLSLSSFGDAPPLAGAESGILVDGGTLTVTSELSVSTVGDLRVAVINGGVLSADSFFVNATGSLLPSTTGTPGSIEIGSDFFASFGGDFVTPVDFDIDGTVHVDAGGQLLVGNVTTSGDIDLSSGGSLTTGNLDALGNVILRTLDFDPDTGLPIEGGAIQAGNIASGGFVDVSSGTSLLVGDVSAGDDISLYANSGSLTAGNLTAALGDPLEIFGDISVDAPAGPVTIGNVNGVSFELNEDEFDEFSSQAFDVVVGNVKVEGIEAYSSGNFTTGDISVGDFYSTIEPDGENNVSLAARNALVTGNIDSETSIALGSFEGSITTGTLSAAESILLLANTNVSTGAQTTGTNGDNSIVISNISLLDTPDFEGFEFDDLEFFAPLFSTVTPLRLNGSVTITGPVNTLNFAAAAQNGISVGAISAPNRLYLDSGSAVSLGTLNTSGAFALTSDGSIVLGDITASSVDLKSLQNVATGSITAASGIVVDAGGTASFSGLVSAPQISVTSRDLSLGEGGRLGTPATSQILLNARGASFVSLGGSAPDASGYVLSSAELQRLSAQRIDITADAPVTLGTVALTGAGAGSAANLAGSSGRLTIDTPSAIRVAGAFSVGNATSGNSLVLRSGDRIAVATDTGGSLIMTGSGTGSLGGTIELVGNSIVVATSSLIDQIASNPNFVGRNAALAAPASSTARLEGNLQANRLDLRAASLIAIQNTGSADQFAGFSAGAGGMVIRSDAPSTAPLDVFIFGRAADSSGAFKINDETLSQVTFSAGEGTATLTPTSAVNNCIVGGSGCAAPEPVTPPEQELIVERIPAAVADAVEGPLSSTSDPENVAALPTINIATTIDAAALRSEPLISDPVSGGGNPSLWEGPADQEDRREEGERPTPRQGDNK